MISYFTKTTMLQEISLLTRIEFNVGNKTRYIYIYINKNKKLKKSKKCTRLQFSSLHKFLQNLQCTRLQFFISLCYGLTHTILHLAFWAQKIPPCPIILRASACWLNSGLKALLWTSTNSLVANFLDFVVKVTKHNFTPSRKLCWSTF